MELCSAVPSPALPTWAETGAPARASLVIDEGNSAGVEESCTRERCSSPGAPQLPDSGGLRAEGSERWVSQGWAQQSGGEGLT